MDDHGSPESARGLRARDVVAQAWRWRRLRRVMTAVLLGLVVWGFSLGALDSRVIAQGDPDLLPVPLEAALLGLAFTVGALPVSWSVIGRVLLPVPTFFLYLAVFLGREPPMPYIAAFVLAGVYAAGLTAM